MFLCLCSQNISGFTGLRPQQDFIKINIQLSMTHSLHQLDGKVPSLERHWGFPGRVFQVASLAERGASAQPLQAGGCSSRVPMGWHSSGTPCWRQASSLWRSWSILCLHSGLDSIRVLEPQNATGLSHQAFPFRHKAFSPLVEGRSGKSALTALGGESAWLSAGSCVPGRLLPPPRSIVVNRLMREAIA